MAVNNTFFNIPSASYLGCGTETTVMPIITCDTVNGAPFVFGFATLTGVETLTNKTFMCANTSFADASGANIALDASALAAGIIIDFEPVGTVGAGTIVLPDPQGAALTILASGSTIPTILNGAITANSREIVTDATPSGDPGSGCATFAGGIGITQNAYIGGVLRIIDATPSGDPGSGCATFAGGIGITQNTYIGGLLRINDATPSGDPSSGCATFGGGIGITQNTYIGGVLRINDATPSGDPGSGCATFGGGIGVTQNTYIGGLLRVTDVTPSTSTITGSATFVGGIGVQERINATNMTCLTAPAVATDVVRLSERATYMLANGTTFLTSVDCTAGGTYTRFNLPMLITLDRIDQMIICTFDTQFTIEYAVDGGPASNELITDTVIPAGWRPSDNVITHVLCQITRNGGAVEQKWARMIITTPGNIMFAPTGAELSFVNVYRIIILTAVARWIV